MQKNKNTTNIINFPNKKSKLEREVEAIIFAAEEPLDIEKIAAKPVFLNLLEDLNEFGINS